MDNSNAARARGLADHGRNERLDYLDGWRGLSILCVLQGHFLTVPGIDLGGFGVLMFFCLSGRLMSHLLFEKHQSLGLFYRRRLSRIFPAFALFVIGMFAMAASDGRAFSWAEFTSTLLFTRTYFPASGIWATGMPIGHLWSLNIEEHAYLLMSLLTLLWVARGREGVILIAAGILCIFTGFLYVKLGQRAPFWGSLGTEVSASYILIAAGYRLVCSRVRPHVPPWLPLVALLMAVSISQASPVWWLGQALNPFLLAFAVNHLSEGFSWFRSVLSRLPLRQFGIWSFSIYLWQQPFYASKDILGMPAALTLAIGAGLVSFYVVERPAREWLNLKWYPARRAGVALT
jgi:peptidoglycan/LPS O-acetylase OafA/YrhL